MKLTELQSCCACGQGLMRNNRTFWYKVTIATEVANLPAIQRAAGMEMFMGGHVPLARIFTADEDLSHSMPTLTGYLCFECLGKSVAEVQAALEGE